MEVTGTLCKDLHDDPGVENCGVVGFVLSSISWLMVLYLTFSFLREKQWPNLFYC